MGAPGPLLVFLIYRAFVLFLWEFLLLGSFIFLKRQKFIPQKFILVLDLGLKWCFSAPTRFGAKCDVLGDASATVPALLAVKLELKQKLKSFFVGDKESSR